MCPRDKHVTALSFIVAERCASAAAGSGSEARADTLEAVGCRRLFGHVTLPKRLGCGDKSLQPAYDQPVPCGNSPCHRSTIFPARNV